MRKLSRSLGALILGSAFVVPVVYASLGAQLSAQAVACPAWGVVQTGAAIAEPSINEASGLVASGDHPGVLWMIEDSFNPPILWAINTEGQTVGEFNLSGAINVDWEDISIDRLPGTDEVYVPDIGDNHNNRDGTARPLPTIYRLPEPDVSASGPVVTATVPVEAFPIRYADESGNLLPPRNAESYMVDPITHDSFIVEKVPHVVNGHNEYWVSRLPAALEPGVVNMAVRVSSEVSGKPTAADISPDGQWIMVKGGGTARLWLRNGTVEQTIDAAPKSPCKAPVGPGESLAQAPEGLWATPDAPSPHLYLTPPA